MKNLKCKKIFFVLIYIFCLTALSHPFKFRIKDKDEKITTIQAIFDTGFSLKGVADGFGITDYEAVFFKPAFHIEEFGIGLDFTFRFRFFGGEITFIKTDWYNTPDKRYELVAAYIDKIDYIKYGDAAKPFFFNIGKNTVTTLGTGFLVSDFHNQAFTAVSKEQGFFFKFNGNNLSAVKRNNIPFDMTLIVNDLLDPDVFMLDAGFDLLKLTKLRVREIFSLRLGQIYAADINTMESNRLSALSDDEELITSHRNLTSDNVFTSIPLFTSFYADFIWRHDFFRLNAFQEIGFLFDITSYAQSGFAFGAGSKQGVEMRVLKIKDSGFLVGLTAALLVDTPNYSIDYFSSNYEVMRSKQYLTMKYIEGISTDGVTSYFLAGLGLYGMNDKVKFNFNLTIPLENSLRLKFSAKFILDSTLVQGLYLSIFYETGMNSFAGLGSGIVDGLTGGFRFSVDGGYKFYAAKLNVTLGMQRAAWVYSVADGDQFWKDIQKFVSLAISFVL